MKSTPSFAEWLDMANGSKTGDQVWCEKLADALCVMLHSFFFRAGLSREDNEDLTQDCVMHVFQHLRQFEGEKFVGWVNITLKHKLVDHFRKLNRRLPTVPLLDCDVDVPTAEFSDCSHNGDLTPGESDAVEEALATLSPEDRQLLLFRAESRDATAYEILAKDFHLSVNATQVRYHRAKKKLAICLRKDPRMLYWLTKHQPTVTKTSAK